MIGLVNHKIICYIYIATETFILEEFGGFFFDPHKEMREIMEGNTHNTQSPGGDVHEKRYIPRWQVDNRVCYQFESGGNAHECRSKDLSCSGICLQTDQGMIPEQNVKLTIDLSDSVSVKVDGRILWSRPSLGWNLAGISFSNVDPEVQDLILDYAFEVKKEDVVKHWFKGWNEK